MHCGGYTLFWSRAPAPDMLKCGADRRLNEERKIRSFRTEHERAAWRRNLGHFSREERVMQGEGHEPPAARFDGSVSVCLAFFGRPARRAYRREASLSKLLQKVSMLAEIHMASSCLR